jgi:hypothetical protein
MRIRTVSSSDAAIALISFASACRDSEHASDTPSLEVALPVQRSRLCDGAYECRIRRRSKLSNCFQNAAEVIVAQCLQNLHNKNKREKLCSSVVFGVNNRG